MRVWPGGRVSRSQRRIEYIAQLVLASAGVEVLGEVVVAEGGDPIANRRWMLARLEKSSLVKV